MAADREGAPTDGDRERESGTSADAELETRAAAPSERGNGDAPSGSDRSRSAAVPPSFESYAAEDLPNATPRGPGKDGVLEATFARSGASGSRTRLLRDRAEVPLHHTGTLDHDPIGPTLCVQEPTGGVAQGDRHRIAIEACDGARCVVTTQAAAKVHSMDSDYAHLDVAVDVAPGAHVEYVPGPTIVNRDARCLQTARVDLAAGASAILSDVLVSDGLSDHEPFGFDHYHARVDARYEGELVCADAVDLRPEERDPRDPASVGEYTVVGTLYVLAPDAATNADDCGDDTGDRGDHGGSNEHGDSNGRGDLDDRGARLSGTVDDLADRLHERLENVESGGVRDEEAGSDAAEEHGSEVDESGADGEHESDEDSSGADGSDANETEQPASDRLRAGASVLPYDAGVGVRVLGTRSDAVERALTAARDEARQALFDVGVPERWGDR